MLECPLQLRGPFTYDLGNDFLPMAVKLTTFAKNVGFFSRGPLIDSSFPPEFQVLQVFRLPPGTVF